MSKSTTNIKIAGLGGMGILTASAILSEVAFRSGCDVKKAEVHGMSQRGGSVCSDVRIAEPGGSVLSPMVPAGEADFLLTLAPEWADLHLGDLAKDGIHMDSRQLETSQLTSRRSLNIAMLGMLSIHLDFLEDFWLAVISDRFTGKALEASLQAFQLGRSTEVSVLDKPSVR